MTPDQVLAEFHDYLAVERDRSPHTIRAYLTDVREYFAWLEGEGIDFLTIEPSNLRAFFGSITGAGMDNGRAKKRRLDARSQRRKLASIRAMYSLLMLRGVLQVNPAKEIRPPRTKKRLPGFIPYAEMRTLLEDMPDLPGELSAERKLRNRALMEILYSTGMRISEALSLRAPAEDAEQIKVLGKGRRERIVFLGEEARRALRDYLAVRPQFRPTTDALFVNRSGAALGDRGARKILLLAGRAAGVTRRVHPHRFRHSMATDLLNEGADIRAVQELLGHRSLASTQVYTGVSKDRLKDVYRRAHPHARSD